MAIRHLISEPIQILTPCKNGKVWLKYQNGRKAEADICELIADGSFKEINQTISAIDATWDYRNFDSADWHIQGTGAA